MDKINELNLAYVKRFMKKKRGWVDQNAVSGLKNIEKGGGHIDRANIKALGHGDLYTKKEEAVVEGLATNVVQKFKANKSDIMAHAITSGMYHVGGLDFGADVASSIHHELKHLPTNLKVLAHKVKNALPKRVAKEETMTVNEGLLSTLKDKLSNKKEKEILASRVKRATAGSTPQTRKDWMGKTKVVHEDSDHRKKLQDLLGKHNNASKIDSIPQTFHKMMATRVAAILMNDTDKAKVMKGLAAQELAKMKEDELIDPNVMINEELVDEGINRPPKKGFHIVQHKDSGQHVMVKTKTIGGAQGIKFHADSKYQHVGAFKSKKHAKGYMDKYLQDKNASSMANAGIAKKHDNGLGIRESVSFKRWSGPFSGKIASARTGTDKIPMSPEDEKMMLDPNSTREQRLGIARKKMSWATENAKKKVDETNSSGTLYHGSGNNMKAYDSLPKEVRHALANSDHNWSASHMKKEYRKNPKVKDAKTAVGFLRSQDAKKHNDDVNKGLHIAPHQRVMEAFKKRTGKSWNPPEVQAKAAKEKKERKMFASGKREIDRLKKAGK